MKNLTEDEKAVLAVLDAESSAFFRGDFDTLACHWWHSPKARRVFSGSDTGTRTQNGWQRISEGLKAAIDGLEKTFDTNDYITRENVQICISEDMAWVHYDQILKQNDPRFLSQQLQSEIKILHRISGEWKIACMVLIAPKLRDENGAKIYVSRDGKISHMSESAKEKLGEDPGLMVKANRVHARNQEFDAALQSEIAHRLSLLDTSLPPAWMNRDVSAIPLGTDDYSRPLFCWVHGDQEAVIVSFDNAEMLQAKLKIAAQTYALSPSQLKLATLLIQGITLADAAETLNVQMTTIRTQLRRMFEKTGARNQTALVSMLLSVERPS